MRGFWFRRAGHRPEPVALIWWGHREFLRGSISALTPDRADPPSRDRDIGAGAHHGRPKSRSGHEFSEVVGDRLGLQLRSAAARPACPSAALTAIEISPPALRRWLVENAARHGVADRIPIPRGRPGSRPLAPWRAIRPRRQQSARTSTDNRDRDTGLPDCPPGMSRTLGWLNEWKAGPQGPRTCLARPTSRAPGIAPWLAGGGKRCCWRIGGPEQADAVRRNSGP